MKGSIKPQWVGNGISAALHGGLLLALILAAGSAPEEVKKLAIDFRLETSQPRATAPVPAAAPPVADVPRVAETPPAAEPAPLPPEQPQAVIPREVPTRPMKRVAKKAKPVPVPEAPSAPALSDSPQPAASAESDSSTGAAIRELLAVQPAAGDNAAPSGQTAARGGTNSGEPEDTTQDDLYKRQHFDHIRDNLQGRIQYPVLARRKGWEGRVVVAFTVCRDGSVMNAKIIESSGFPVLDNSALATIKEAAPLPLPPVQAELVIPIVFKLG